MFKMSSSCLKCHKAFDPFAASGAPDSMHVDHVVPSSKGGPDHLSNYQPLCSPCNTSKGNRSSADYRSAEQKALYPMPAEIRRRHEEAERAAAAAREQSKRKAEAQAIAKANRLEAERAAAAAFYASPDEVAKRAAQSAQQLKSLRKQKRFDTVAWAISAFVFFGLCAAFVVFAGMTSGPVGFVGSVLGMIMLAVPLSAIPFAFRDSAQEVKAEMAAIEDR